MSWKLSIVILFFFVLTGCSSVRKNAGSGFKTENQGELDIVKNIPFKTLFIPRAQVELDIDGRNETLIATIKYNEGKWLLSIRSEDGIELARALVTVDTVLVNDRLNRELYYGRPENLRSSYGFGRQDLSLILGVLQDDFLVSSKTDCIDGLIHIGGTTNGSSVTMDYKCSTSLLNNVTIEYGGVKEGLSIEYLKYKDYDNIKLPTLIEIKMPKERITLVIRIFGHQINETVNTDFIPGNNYDKVLIK